MPRPKLPARLVLRADRPTDEERAAGIKRYNWVIRDGDRYVRTGCAEGEIAQAADKLGEYLAEQKNERNPVKRNGKASELSVGDILSVYLEERASSTARPKETEASLFRLNEFWGHRKASQILGPMCREYAKVRGSVSGARRDLENLRAAVNHYKREYGLEFAPAITLPQKSISREKWLTRAEAAALLWACWRDKSNKRRHLVRFILIGVYTGTRHDAILRLQWLPNTTGGWADLDNALIYRRAEKTRETKKRTPTARIPGRLLAHMKRWRALDQGILPIVHYHGRAISRLEKSFRSARAEAGLGPDAIPHALRHTAITWLMQEGHEINDVASWAGVTVEELQRTYWHHHPDFQGDIATKRMGQNPGSRANTRANK
jgi:integrase